MYAATYQTLEGIDFYFVSELQPIRAADGAVVTLLPQSRYDNSRGLPLNRYGSGPFCKFVIPSANRQSGVYIIMAGGAVKYVGECANLSARFNAGYGNISPKNCFKHGQETNCRLNHLILNSVTSGEVVTLWFHPAANHKVLEATIRFKSLAPWNRS